MERFLSCLFFVVFTININAINSTVILVNENRDTMIEFTSTISYCRILTDRDTIDFVYESRPTYVKFVPDDHFAYMLKKCEDSFEDVIERGLKFIYPGTKWCGPGNAAKNYSDLGVHEAEDACCREHDNCPVNVEGKQCINGICNDSRYTRSHCGCDERFQKCLQDVNTETANTIGAIFFNVARIICFREKDDCDVRNSDKCVIEFVENAQYRAPRAPFQHRNFKAYYLNKLLRGLHLL